MSNIECSHTSCVVTGKMESTPVDSVYVIPCKCYDCNNIVYEKYYYEGIIIDKDKPEV